MKTRFLGWLLPALLSAALTSSTFAEIYTIPNVTHSANATEHFNFDSAWTGSPAINAISGQTSLYLKFTANWSASAAPGDFDVRFAVDDSGGRGRAHVNFNHGAIEIYSANADGDGDGAGPATVRPAFSINTTSETSATFVLRVDQTLASPGGDWNFGTIGQQSGANAFIYVNPNLVASEASNSTVLAGWRSGQNSYQSVTFQTTNLAAGGMSFTNIALYTGDDTPFSSAPPVVDPATSTVSASPSAVPADDTTTSSITVTLKDAGGNPVPGKEVSLTGNGSATISTASNISDANGEVVFAVRSSVAGPEVFTATNVTDSNMVITQTASVDFQEVIAVGPVDAANSTVWANPTSVIANAVSTATVTVTLRDSNGQLVIGEDVTLGGSPANASIAPSVTQTTDANGEASFTVSSGLIGTIVFSATSSTDSVVVTQTASVDFTDPQDAEAFNVNFLDDGQADETGLVGVVGEAGETWNQGTTSVTNLVDTTGTVTTSVSVSGLSSSGRPISGSNLSLFKANRDVFDKGGNYDFSITGLTPDAPYDLYIYALSHNTGSWEDISNTERAAGEFVTTNTVLGNGPSQWIDNAVAGTSGDAFVPNGNFVEFQSIVADGSGTITITVDAYDGIDGDPSTNDGDTRLHVCGLQIRPASGMSVDYIHWSAGNFPGLGLPDEDDDGDGFSNDYERIFGLDPTSANSVRPVTISVDPATGQFSYTRRAQALANLNYKVWVSTDLDQWTEDNAASQIVQSTSNGVEHVDVNVDPSLLGETKLFVQIRTSTITGVDIAPALLSVRGSGNTMTLLFSEPMNASSAGNPDNYTAVLDGGGALAITDTTVSSDGGSVTLTLDSTLAVDTDYTVTVNGVTSGTGQALGGNVSRSFRTYDDDASGVKVFILAGQSNMVGRGESERGNGDVDGAIGSLRYQVVNDNANYGQLVVDAGNPASDDWVVRSDVNFWWNRADIGAGPAISKGGLNPQGFGSGPETFGPEFGFGWAVGDHYSEPVLVIKTAWGGKDLMTNFRPPSAVAARGGVVGPYYIELIEQVREVLGNLAGEFPEWSGQGYEIVGFGWHQGWNDSLNTFASNEYEANMVDFITDIRAEFGKPNLPFSIGTTGMIGAATSGNRLTVVNAQINVANPALHPELGGNVFTVDTRPFARTDAQSPTNDSTHWRNNGESMWLMGKGMGDGMVELLSAP